MILDYLKSGLIYVLPHHAISRIVFRLTRVECPRIVPTAIRLFTKVFKVNLAEAVYSDAASYPTFNAFFTRALKAEARQVIQNPQVLACPVDGCVSQVGRIQEGRIFQAKGLDYTVLELLGGDAARAEAFLNGQFTTIYLSPRDYHRIHMPINGVLKEQVYIPGRLFSVAGHTVRTVPRIFARNERVVAIFDTDHGLMAMVLVGAINVAAIETVWAGLITPPPQKPISVQTFADVILQQGQEMGRFNMGSTVILLLANTAMQWEAVYQPNKLVQLGEPVAVFDQSS